MGRTGGGRRRVHIALTRLAGISTAATALALGGCSETAPPEPSTPVTTETSALEEPDITPYPVEDLPPALRDQVEEPLLTGLAREHSPAGAEAFVQYVVDATNWIMATGDPEPLLSVCAEESVYCSNAQDGSKPIQRGEYTRHGGSVSIQDMPLIEFEIESQKTLVWGVFASKSYIDLGTDGSKIREREGYTSEIVLHLHFDGDQWQLIEAGDYPE